MTDINNMKITEEELENVSGGKSKLILFSPCIIGIHELPEYGVIIGFNLNGSYYWEGQCSRCKKYVFTKDNVEISF